MKNKSIALFLAVVMLVAVSVSALAATDGLVNTHTWGNGGWLNVRATSSSSSSIIGHMDDGTPITVYETVSGMTHIRGWGYTDPNNKGGTRKQLDGWAKSECISIYAR